MNHKGVINHLHKFFQAARYQHMAPKRASKSVLKPPVLFRLTATVSTPVLINNSSYNQRDQNYGGYEGRGDQGGSRGGGGGHWSGGGGQRSRWRGAL